MFNAGRLFQTMSSVPPPSPSPPLRRERASFLKRRPRRGKDVQNVHHPHSHEDDLGRRGLSGSGVWEPASGRGRGSLSLGPQKCAPHSLCTSYPSFSSHASSSIQALFKSQMLTQALSSRSATHAEPSRAPRGARPPEPQPLSLRLSASRKLEPTRGLAPKREEGRDSFKIETDAFHS